MHTMILLLAAVTVFPAFMKGSWRANLGGAKVEEHWTSGDGGLMVGMNRTVAPDGKTSFEFLRIQEKDGALAYLAMPGGGPETAFPLKSLTKSRVVFENVKHDFPQRIIYWRKEKQLCARVEGMMNGKLEGEEWCWDRFTP
jgi:uncharacterized protein DUF6265